jgi:hypothetical protein
MCVDHHTHRTSSRPSLPLVTPTSRAIRIPLLVGSMWAADVGVVSGRRLGASRSHHAAVCSNPASVLPENSTCDAGVSMTWFPDFIGK